VEIGFEYLKGHPPFTEESRRLQLLERLNRISRVQLPISRIGLRPSFDIRLLKDPEALTCFTAAMSDVADELRRAARAEFGGTERELPQQPSDSQPATGWQNND
jgi:hypothetical protein